MVATPHCGACKPEKEREHGVGGVCPIRSARAAGVEPVRIPIDKGLFGWRVALICAEDAAAFAGIQTLAQLANPLLPPDTPLQRKELWFRPASAR